MVSPGLALLIAAWRSPLAGTDVMAPPPEFAGGAGAGDDDDPPLPTAVTLTSAMLKSPDSTVMVSTCAPAASVIGTVVVDHTCQSPDRVTLVEALAVDP